MSEGARCNETCWQRLCVWGKFHWKVDAGICAHLNQLSQTSSDQRSNNIAADPYWNSLSSGEMAFMCNNDTYITVQLVGGYWDVFPYCQSYVGRNLRELLELNYYVAIRPNMSIFEDNSALISFAFFKR